MNASVGMNHFPVGLDEFQLIQINFMISDQFESIDALHTNQDLHLTVAP